MQGSRFARPARTSAGSRFLRVVLIEPLIWIVLVAAVAVLVGGARFVYQRGYLDGIRHGRNAAAALSEEEAWHPEGG